ncbi:hypothetical protein D3C85_922220 [compost metagenome]
MVVLDAQFTLFIHRIGLAGLDPLLALQVAAEAVRAVQADTNLHLGIARVTIGLQHYAVHRLPGFRRLHPAEGIVEVGRRGIVQGLCWVGDGLGGAFERPLIGFKGGEANGFAALGAVKAAGQEPAEAIVKRLLGILVGVDDAQRLQGAVIMAGLCHAAIG